MVHAAVISLVSTVVGALLVAVITSASRRAVQECKEHKSVPEEVESLVEELRAVSAFLEEIEDGDAKALSRWKKLRDVAIEMKTCITDFKRLEAHRGRGLGGPEYHNIARTAKKLKARARGVIELENIYDHKSK
ncbi:hypothetical protein SETIT_8G198600v2 [Setaria italica]|uniref:Disease resistance N-terminal domain-containing protein n=1 Tax=Setaria italica TaxID=4555 RepID=A0A368S9V3_SETIT|nr:hypothetical protein SETIT_8G198600v2 [Setaria italica]